jgi:hypothetical protein
LAGLPALLFGLFELVEHRLQFGDARQQAFGFGHVVFLSGLELKRRPG